MATPVFAQTDLCNGDTGRLVILPDGEMYVQDQDDGGGGGPGELFPDGACFTSLDGVTYALSTAYFNPLGLENGWANSPYSTAPSAYRNLY